MNNVDFETDQTIRSLKHAYNDYLNLNTQNKACFVYYTELLSLIFEDILIRSPNKQELDKIIDAAKLVIKEFDRKRTNTKE
jgi:hypothetical protein